MRPDSTRSERGLSLVRRMGNTQLAYERQAVSTVCPMLTDMDGLDQQRKDSP